MSKRGRSSSSEEEQSADEEHVQKRLERLVAEKEERIAELEERIAELEKRTASRIADLKKKQKKRRERLVAEQKERIAGLKKLYEERIAEQKKLYEEHIAEQNKSLDRPEARIAEQVKHLDAVERGHAAAFKLVANEAETYCLVLANRVFLEELLTIVYHDEATNQKQSKLKLWTTFVNQHLLTAPKRGSADYKLNPISHDALVKEFQYDKMDDFARIAKELPDLYGKLSAPFHVREKGAHGSGIKLGGPDADIVFNLAMRRLHALSASKLRWNFADANDVLRLREVTQLLDNSLKTQFSLKYDFDHAKQCVVSKMTRPKPEPLQPHAPGNQH
jgi:TolA-binding protein